MHLGGGHEGWANLVLAETGWRCVTNRPRTDGPGELLNVTQVIKCCKVLLPYQIWQMTHFNAFSPDVALRMKAEQFCGREAFSRQDALLVKTLSSSIPKSVGLEVVVHGGPVMAL